MWRRSTINRYAHAKGNFQVLPYKYKTGFKTRHSCTVRMESTVAKYKRNMTFAFHKQTQMNVKQILTTVTEQLTVTTPMVPLHAVVGQVTQVTVGLVILWVSQSSRFLLIKSQQSPIRVWAKREKTSQWNCREIQSKVYLLLGEKRKFLRS